MGKTRLAHYLKVIESSHIWVSPSMNGDIVIALESELKLIRITYNVGADHEVRCCPIF